MKFSLTPIVLLLTLVANPTLSLEEQVVRTKNVAATNSDENEKDEAQNYVWHEGKNDNGHEEEEKPDTIPDQITTVAPTSSPECKVKLGCLHCIVTKNCFFGLAGGGGACFECKNQQDTCGRASGAVCEGYPPYEVGRDTCVKMIKDKCGDPVTILRL